MNAFDLVVTVALGSTMATVLSKEIAHPGASPGGTPVPQDQTGKTIGRVYHPDTNPRATVSIVMLPHRVNPAASPGQRP